MAQMPRAVSSRYLGKILKPAILWLIVIYILLQITVIVNHSGTVKSVLRSGKTGVPQVSQAPFDSFRVVDVTTSQSPAVRNIVPSGDIQVGPEVKDQTTPKKKVKVDYDPVSTEPCGKDVRLLRGVPRDHRGFLTIGLTSVPRENEFYLPDTLQSLVEKMSAEDRDKVVIVLYIGSQDGNFTTRIISMLDDKFAEQVNTGLIQVIQPLPYVYPDFARVTKRTFNDTLDRVHWRTKQNVDFATLFSYCENISDYYMHVEDDVIAATGYVGDVKNLLDRVTSKAYTKVWFELDFSTLGFIGRLFRSSDLCMIKKFLLLFQVEKPCDILLNDLKQVMMQPKDIRNPKSLFQHVGKTSSLKGKVQDLTDKNFKDLKRSRASQRGRSNVIEKDLTISYKHSLVPNPMPARIVTNMETFGDYIPEKGYFSFEKGFYWAKTPVVNSSYRVEYNVSTHVDAITVRTGHPKKFIDMLEKGVVRIGLGNTSDSDNCGKFVDVGNFDKGQFYVHFNNTMEIKCLDVVVTQPMKTWLIIAEVNIDTDSESEGELVEDDGSRGSDKQTTER